MNIRDTNPDAFIIFYPYKHPVTDLGTPFSPELFEVKPFEVRTDIMSLSTSKPKGGHGSWSVTLAPRLNYRSIIQPGCWCMIHMLDNSMEVHGSPTNGANEEAGLKMLGIVRSIRAMESIDPNTGTRHTQFVISGDDFHSVLDAQIYISPLQKHDDPKQKPVVDQLILFKKQFSQPLSPDHIVKELIKAILGASQSLESSLAANTSEVGAVYGIPGPVAKRLTGAPASDSKFVNIFQRLFYSDLAGKLMLQPDLGSLFSLWSLIQTYSHNIVNEVFTDLFPVKTSTGVRLLPSIVMRPIPFTSKVPDETKDGDGNAQRLPYLRIRDSKPRAAKDLDPDSSYGFYTSKQIEESEIMGMNYGKSDAERFNFFYVSSNFMSQQGLIANNLKPLTNTKNFNITDLSDPNSILRHGLRPYITQSQYVNLRTYDILGTNKLVRDMWEKAHYYENGSVILVGQRHHIPVGTNIEFKERGWIAHVEQVSHSYTVSPSGRKAFRTTLSFVRLQNKSNGLPIDLAYGDKSHSATSLIPVHQEMPRGDYDPGDTTFTAYTYNGYGKGPNAKVTDDSSGGDE